MKITKAIIPATGFGTHVLLISGSISKEVLPVVDKPAIQYITGEAVRSDITDILTITNCGKGLIEDHSDRAPEPEAHLARGGVSKKTILSNIVEIFRLVNVYFVRQKKTRGLGHAVNCACSFIGNKPSAVLYGDNVIIGKGPACDQLIRTYEEFGKGVLGVNKVPPKAVGRYSLLKVEPVHDRLLRCTDMTEKSSPGKVFSYYSTLGRCVLPPEIFNILNHTPPGGDGEIQLADTMRVLAQTVGMAAVRFTGGRYDMGNKLDILQATVKMALEHPEVEEGFRRYIREIADTL